MPRPRRAGTPSIESVARHKVGIERLGRTRITKQRALFPNTEGVVENLILLLNIEEFGYGEPVANSCRVGGSVSNLYFVDVLAIEVRKGIQNNTVDYRKDNGHGPDAEREGQYRREKEIRSLVIDRRPNRRS